MKSEKTKLAPFLCTCLTGAAVALFLGVFYSYHLYYQEQFQLFEFSWRYFLTTAAAPGGLADYLAKFLTQFFYYSWTGAVITALIIAGIQWTTHKLSGNLPLSLIPATLMLIFLMNGEAMLCAPVAMLIVLAAACISQNKKDRRSARHQGIVCIVVSLVLYTVAGPMAVVYPLVICAPVTPILAVPVVLYHKIAHYSYLSLLYGVHYYRFVENLPLWPWIAAAAAVAIILLGRKAMLSGKWNRLALAAVVAASVAGVWIAADFEREEAMKYDFLARRAQWKTIIAEARKKSPDTPNNVVCLNLALAMTGQTEAHMFDFFQCGTEGLMIPLRSEFESPLPSAEVYYWLGMINTSKRFYFSVQESLPDHQRSARCCKRLAETNIINGDYDAALVYLKPLTRTIFYRGWALHTISILGDEDAIAKDPVYSTLRSYRLHNRDFMFNRDVTDSMLAFLLEENPKNIVATEYLYAWLLLDKNLDEFKAMFGEEAFAKIPKKYQSYYDNYVKPGEAK